MDALLSVYGDGRTEHGDGLAALAPASRSWPAARRAVAEQRRPGELRPRSRRASHSRREARRASGGGRWSGSALRGRTG